MKNINNRLKKILIEDFFGLNSYDTAVNDIDKIKEEDLDKKIFQEKIEVIDNNKLVTLEVKSNGNEIINLASMSGLVTKEFERALDVFKDLNKKAEPETNYSLNGSYLGGALTSYITVLQGIELKLQTVSFNGIGIKNFTKFNGNEFLGYKMGMKYYLDNYINENIDMRLIKEELIFLGVLEEGNISGKYRKSFGTKIDKAFIKRELKKAVKKILKLSKEEAEELVEENFNPELIERKMRFIDNYNTKNEKNIINYIFFDNLPARISKQIGSTYLVDKDLKKFNGGVDDELIDWINRLEEDELNRVLDQNRDLFMPFILRKEDGNGKNAKNRLGNTPEIGNMTNKLSISYLAGLIKDIVLDLKKKDEKIIEKLFDFSQRGMNGEFLEVIKDRLRHSIKLEKRIDLKDILKSRYFTENPDILTEEDKKYFHANTAISNLDNMDYRDVERLWRWSIKPDNISLILGEEGVTSKEDIVEYKEGNIKLNNKEEELNINLEEPSKNIILGSGTPSRKNSKKDNEYLNEDKYSFLPNRGIGRHIASQNTDPNRDLEVDGNNLSGKYVEVDEIDGLEKQITDKFFGENFRLQESGGKKRLIYYYGPDKEDELVIDGFKDGDYGIKLQEKRSTYVDKKVPIKYTEQKIRIGDFEFINLDEFKITKEINKHSRFVAKGRVRHEDKQKYKNMFLVKSPSIVISHGEDEIPMFKGRIYKYNLDEDYYGQDLRLEIYGISYSWELEKGASNRMFQNMGTLYTEAFEKVMEKNPEFDISFGTSEMDEMELVTDEYPMVYQYEESEWDFIKRLASYLNQPVIVNDTKALEDIVNIKVGIHDLESKPLNNISRTFIGRTDEKGVKRNYYKTYKHCHSLSDNIYGIGYPVEYNIGVRGSKKEDLIVLRNEIYISKGNLYSDITLTKNDWLKMEKRKRYSKIHGIGLRAEVKEVYKDHTAQVEFVDIENEFKKGKSYKLPLDKPYTGAYFSPEKGDIVEVYIKSNNEKYATIRNTLTEKQKTQNDPLKKRLLTKSEQEILLNDKDKEIAFRTFGDECSLRMKKEYIDIKNATASLKMQEDGTVELASGDNKINISKDGLYKEALGNRIDMNKDGVVITAKNGEVISMKDGALTMEAGGKKIGFKDGEIILK
ncbi:MAG: hypothetical protein ACQERZ_05730 [Fusobacteriota bacterium]